MQQLRYLEAAVRLGSFASASSACFVSQPALSVQIKNLEDELGMKLLKRLPRGVVATPAGEHVALVARRVLRELSQLSKEVRRRHLLPGPMLRLGVQPFIASEILPQVLRTLPKGMGRLTVRERPQLRLIDALLSDEVDVVVMAATERLPSGLEVRPLLTVNYGLFCPAKHPLTLKRRIMLSDLLKYEVVLFQDSTHIEQRLMERAVDANEELNVVFSGDHGISAFEMVSEGLGVGLLPMSFAPRAKRRRLKVLPIGDPKISLHVVAIYRDSSVLSPMAEFLFSNMAKQSEPIAVPRKAVKAKRLKGG